MLSGSNFVVVFFNIEAHIFHDTEHLATQVLTAIYWIDWEVAALCAWTVAHVTGIIFSARINWQFSAI